MEPARRSNADAMEALKKLKQGNPKIGLALEAAEWNDDELCTRASTRFDLFTQLTSGANALTAPKANAVCDCFFGTSLVLCCSHHSHHLSAASSSAASLTPAATEGKKRRKIDEMRAVKEEMREMKEEMKKVQQEVQEVRAAKRPYYSSTPSGAQIHQSESLRMCCSTLVFNLIRSRLFH